MLALSLGLWLAGARFNMTRSMPRGLYWRVDKPIERGDYVDFCPEPAPAFELARRRGYLGVGFCPGRYERLLKRVAGMPGDLVEFAADGVRVDGRLLPSSRPLPRDPSGRPLPVWPFGRRRLGPQELLFMSDVSALSFDARYFGPQDRAGVRDVLRPVWTWR
ncbi:MAG TPA: conjugative transfer signal peptidase TraF [Burkholderiaceae bacterium]